VGILLIFIQYFVWWQQTGISTRLARPGAIAHVYLNPVAAADGGDMEWKTRCCCEVLVQAAQVVSGWQQQILPLKLTQLSYWAVLALGIVGGLGVGTAIAHAKRNIQSSSVINLW